MKLSWQGFSAHLLGVDFIREGARTDKRALRHMRRVSKLVMEQSIKNSPVDWKGYSSADPPRHELERSHRIEERYGNRGRIEATVAVGGMVGETDVDLYVEWLHDGSYDLGRASIAKQASTPGAMVGERFLERALEQHEAEFDGLMDELMMGLMG